MKKFINPAINFVDQINWHEVGQAIVKAVAFTYTLGYCLGLWVHRTNAQLSAIAGDLADPTRRQRDADVPRAEQPTAPAAPHLPVLAPGPRRRVSLADWLQADGWDEAAVEALVCRRPRP
jgi:hypothetical protein